MYLPFIILLFSNVNLQNAGPSIDDIDEDDDEDQFL
jgi:hypothetical protein